MENVKTNRVFGVLLSLINPGLGMIYSGSISVGLTFLVLLPALAALFISGVAISDGLSYWLSALIFIGPYLGMVIFSVYRNFTTFSRPGASYHKWYIYVLVHFLIIAVGDSLVPSQNYTVLKVASGGMLPTFELGDRVFVEKNKEISRGDVIAWKDRKNGFFFIKRVVGLPGDMISFDGKFIAVNGESLEFSNVVSRAKRFEGLKGEYDIANTTTGTVKHEVALVQDREVEPISDVVVPENCYYVVGDNRFMSMDSRFLDLKTVCRENTVGKVKFVVFPLTSRTRNSRFGSYKVSE